MTLLCVPFSCSLDDPYANQDGSYGQPYEPPTYDYNAQMPTSPYDNIPSPEYPVMNDDPCMTTEWSDWSECSATCDSGSQSRMKDYIDRE